MPSIGRCGLVRFGAAVFKSSCRSDPVDPSPDLDCFVCFAVVKRRTDELHGVITEHLSLSPIIVRIF